MFEFKKAIWHLDSAANPAIWICKLNDVRSFLPYSATNSPVADPAASKKQVNKQVNNKEPRTSPSHRTIDRYSDADSPVADPAAS
jgi:hypothetical protein